MDTGMTSQQLKRQHEVGSEHVFPLSAAAIVDVVVVLPVISKTDLRPFVGLTRRTAPCMSQYHLSIVREAFSTIDRILRFLRSGFHIKVSEHPEITGSPMSTELSSAKHAELEHC